MDFGQRKLFVIGKLSTNGLILTTVFQHLQRITKTYRDLKYIIDYYDRYTENLNSIDWQEMKCMD
jgi:hypothetical protein